MSISNTHTEHSVLSIAEKMVVENEGFRVKPYRDTVGKLTISFGRNLDDRGIRWDEAKMLLAHDLIEAHNVLFGEFDFYQRMNDARKAVLMDLYHNMGLTRLMGFKKMLKAAQLGQWDEAANELKDSRYFRQVGRRGRRNFTMMKFGKFMTISESEEYFNR